MTKETKLRLLSGALAVTLATSIFVFNPQKAYAETGTRYTHGTFIEEPMEYEESQYGRYVVKQGDNASRISEKICRHFNVEITTKYWPVIAFLNGFPRVIQPGDIMIFPNSIEDMDSLLNSLRETGWLARYIQKNDVYGKRKKSRRTTVGELLTEIYGNSVCVDPDFVQLYQETIGMGNMLTYDTPIEYSTDMLFYLTEWIPTLQEIDEFQQEREQQRSR